METSTYNNIITSINIIAIVLSPIIAVWVSSYLNNKNELRKEKMAIFKTLMLCRIGANNMDYVRALNVLDVVFADSPKVRRAYNELYQHYALPINDDTSYILATKTKSTKLIEEIAKDLGYTKQLEWSEIISSSYLPNWLSREYQRNANMAEGQEMVVDLIRNVTRNTASNLDTQNTTEKSSNE